MIRLQIDGNTEELAEEFYAGGLKLMIENYDDETVGVQVGSYIVEVDRKTLLKMVDNLKFDKEV